MNAIKKIRMKSNLTQKEVARKLQIDRSTVAKWETGKADPRAEELTKLAKLFGCTVDELLTDTAAEENGKIENVLKKLEEQLELLSKLSKKDLPETVKIAIAEEIRQIAETYSTITYRIQ